MPSTKKPEGMSQSLSIRAMSFDGGHNYVIFKITFRLNPFRSGQCLSTRETSEVNRNQFSLNPFRSGQCLSTELRREEEFMKLSQSLSIRAMSFDTFLS